MSIELPGAVAPDLLPCRYGASRLLCRGPRRSLDKPYVAFLGGSETFGKFVQHPFPALLEPDLGLPCINLGAVNAGLDSFVQDPEILRIANDARQVIVQVMGAQNLSNRFYRVHPRRNDRFLSASAVLSAIYREVDFTDFNFNKHMLTNLLMSSPDRFALIRQELQLAWSARMRLLLGALRVRPLLLWLRFEDETGDTGLGPEPLLVTRAMLKDLSADLRGVVEMPVRRAGVADDLKGMQYGPMQAPAAAHAIGPDTHREIARRLAGFLSAGQ